MSSTESPGGPAGPPPEATPVAAADDRSVTDPGARSQARIAIITAIVALVSAILGPVVSLLINNSQIDSQSANNAAQAKVNARQSEDEFVRTERRDAYTEFLAAYNDTALAFVEAMGAFSSADVGAAAASDYTRKNIDAVKDVSAKYYTVRLVASDEALTAAEDAYGTLSTFSNEVLTIGGNLAAGQTTTKEQRDTIATESKQTYEELINLSDGFIKAGRVDIATRSD